MLQSCCKLPTTGSNGKNNKSNPMYRGVTNDQPHPYKRESRGRTVVCRLFVHINSSSSIFNIFDPKRHLPYWACAHALSVRAALWACIYNIVTYEPNSGCKNLKKKIQDKKYLQCGMNMMKMCRLKATHYK